MMAATASCCIIHSKNLTGLPAENFLPYEKGKTTANKFSSRNVCRFSSSHGIVTHGRRLTALHDDAGAIICRSMGKRVFTHFFCRRGKAFQRNPWKITGVGNHVRSSSKCFSWIGKSILWSHRTPTICRDRLLKVLDSYGEADNGLNQRHSFSTSVQDSRVTAETGLISLENYFDKLSDRLQKRNDKRPCPTKADLRRNQERRFRVPLEELHKQTPSSRNESKDQMPDDEADPLMFADKDFQDSEPYVEASDFYLTNLMASINIAVFLFEIASPIRNSDVEQLSLLLMYGGKVNELILGGEWWRLVTPMFLHSGFLHVVLGFWVLITFGPPVCRGYGPMIFFFIYLLGGISASITSFIHAPAITVCGTGPVFAIIGAWLVYHSQNKEIASKEGSKRMFLKAGLATLLSFLISYFEEADQWSNLGAALSGVAYGFLTFPDAMLKDKDIGLLRRQANPLKSTVIFSLFIVLLCFVVMGFQTNLNIFTMDEPLL